MFCLSAKFFLYCICIEHIRNIFDADDTARMKAVPFVISFIVQLIIFQENLVETD